MGAGYRIGRKAPELRIGTDKVVALYTGSQLLYPSSLSFTMPMARGTYSTVRYPVNLRVGIDAVVLDSGMLTRTTPPVTLRARRYLITSGRSHPVVRNPMLFVRALRMTASGSILQLFGQNASTPIGNVMSAEQGIFAITRRPASMQPDRYMATAGRTFTWNRVAATLRATHRMVASGVSFTLNGHTLGVSKGFHMTAAGISLTVTRVAANVRPNRRLVMAMGAFTRTSAATTLRVARRLNAAPHQTVTTSYPANQMRAARRLDAGPHSALTWSRMAANFVYVSNPQVIGFDSTVATTATTSVPIPSGTASGDTVFLFVSVQSIMATTVNTPSGWTELYKVNVGNLRAAACYTRLTDGSEGASVDVTTSGGNASFLSVTTRSVTVFEAATPVLANVSGSPNPPALTMAGGNGKLWFSVVHTRGSGSSTAPTPSTGYTLIGTAYQSSGQSTRISVAAKTANAASEDPDAWAPSIATYATTTIAIR